MLHATIMQYTQQTHHDSRVKSHLVYTNIGAGTDAPRAINTQPHSVSVWRGLSFSSICCSHHANKKLRATCSSVNWSPPKAATHGLIPPVPNATNVRPINTNHLRTFTYIRYICNNTVWFIVRSDITAKFLHGLTPSYLGIYSAQSGPMKQKVNP